MRRRFDGRPGMVLTFVLGLVIATAATAGAASLITGKQIKDGTISAKDLNKAVRAQLARSGRRGAPGARGTQGAQGVQGVQGPQGPAGPVDGKPAGGALSGSYPNPGIASAQAPIDVAANPGTATDPCADPNPTFLTLCGTTAARWINEGFGLPGAQVYRDQLGQVHIRGAIHVSTGGIGSLGSAFRLPPDLRPKRLISDMVITGNAAGAYQSGTALVIIYPTGTGSDGYVGLFSPSNSAHTVVHFGDLTFRTDA